MSRALHLCLLVATVTGCSSTQVVGRDGDRAILLRSGQPNAGSLARAHERYGVRTVINLRGAQPEEAWYRSERRGVAAIDARWVHMMMSSRTAPARADLDRFFDLVEDPDNWPILVHCQGGVHRTGLMVALYRRQYEGWSADDAIAEMERNGFDWGGARPQIKRYVREFEPDPARALPRSSSRRATSAEANPADR